MILKQYLGEIMTQLGFIDSNQLEEALIKQRELIQNKKKQQQIIQGVYGFLDENPKYQGNDVRLDVIIVDFSEYPAKITHHQGAYYDEGDSF